MTALALPPVDLGSTPRRQSISLSSAPAPVLPQATQPTRSVMRQEGLQVCKKALSVEASADVDRAIEVSKELTRMEVRGPGDTPGAWRRLEARYGVDYGTFWALRYRRPAAIFSHILRRIEHAYAAECERQTRRLQHELDITRARLGASHPVVLACEASLGAEDGEVGS